MADNGENPEDRKKLTPEKAVDVEITSNENDSAQERRIRFAKNRGEAQIIDMDSGETSGWIPGLPHTTSSRRSDTEIPFADARSTSTSTDDASVPRRTLKRKSSSEHVTEQASKSGPSNSDEPVASSSNATGVRAPPKSRGIIATILSPISRFTPLKKEETPGSDEAAAKKSSVPGAQPSSTAKLSPESQSTSLTKEASPSSGQMVDIIRPKLKKRMCPCCCSVEQSSEFEMSELTIEPGTLRVPCSTTTSVSSITQFTSRTEGTTTGTSIGSILLRACAGCGYLCESTDSESSLESVPVSANSPDRQDTLDDVAVLSTSEEATSHSQT